MNIELLDAEPSTNSNNALADYSATEAGLAELEGRLQGRAYDLTTVKGDKEARADRQECVKLRTAADAVYKAWNEPMLATQKKMRERRDQLKERVLAVELPIDEQIKADEVRRAAEKAEREAAEKARIAIIHQRISDIRGYVAQAAECRTAAAMEELVIGLKAIDIGENDFAEYVAASEVVRTDALRRLEEMRAAKLAEEAERERIKAEQAAEAARLKAEREALAAQRVEQERIEREARERREAEEAVIRAERERQESAARHEREAAEAKLREQREEFEREQAEFRLRQSELMQQEEAKRAEAVRETEEIIKVATMEPMAIEVAVITPSRPSDGEIVQAVAQAFGVATATAKLWLAELDLDDLDLTANNRSAT